MAAKVTEDVRAQWDGSALDPSFDMGEDGSVSCVHVSPDSMTVDELEQVVAQHKVSATHHMQMANGYADRANRRFGTKSELPYPE